MREKIPVAILGATGTVGQKFIQHLAGHPWFQIGALAASERSSGKTYAEAVSWKQKTPIPDEVRDLPVESCDDDLGCPIVFSGLSASAAGPVEQSFARRGSWVFSNARNHRMDADVPLLLAELNPDHLEVVRQQQKQRGWPGAIVTNANCSTIILALALGPLYRSFDLNRVHVVTMQAVSGAGYPGVASLDILGNVIPFIRNEEEKVESETLKILGRLEGSQFQPANLTVSAQTNRVPVEDGHLECVSVGLGKKASAEEIVDCWNSFRGRPQELELPSAPRTPIVYVTEPDRPQPRFDVEKLGGMSVLVGRLRPCALLDYKFIVLGHNTIRGAAGASVLNAELAVKTGML